jgi:hypothetical protein
MNEIVAFIYLPVNIMRTLVDKIGFLKRLMQEKSYFSSFFELGFFVGLLLLLVLAYVLFLPILIITIN